MPNLVRKQAIYAKVETEAQRTTGGHPATAFDRSDLIICRDISATPLEAEVVERTLIRPTLGGFQELVARFSSAVTITVDLMGGGMDTTTNTTMNDPQMDVLLQGAGMKKSTYKNDGTSAETAAEKIRRIVYTPDDPSTAQTITILYQLDGIYQIMSGSRGNVVFNFPIGEIPSAEFTFISNFVRPLKISNALRTQLNTGTQRPSTRVTPYVFNSRYSSVNSAKLYKTQNDSNSEKAPFVDCVHNLSIDIGNANVIRECVTNTDPPTGDGTQIILNDRSSTGSITLDAEVYREAVAATDYPDIWEYAGLGTLIDGSVTSDGLANAQAVLKGIVSHGYAPGTGTDQRQVAGNSVIIGAPQLSVGAPTQGDIEGIATYEAPLRFLPKDGNDEVRVEFRGAIDKEDIT